MEIFVYGVYIDIYFRAFSVHIKIILTLKKIKSMCALV